MLPLQECLIKSIIGIKPIKLLLWLSKIVCMLPRTLLVRVWAIGTTSLLFNGVLKALRFSLAAEVILLRKIPMAI
ncbi:unnamed protein product [Ceratitis capitata]|uniref:(Mediterranean fruit fly) hypothetical protein n=1 Tax=Ceratitis capitata TaxID=7213 RepID=A0A811VHT0_CERCA|nr:unnamed protein product [Ceratitis capitata]